MHRACAGKQSDPGGYNRYSDRRLTGRGFGTMVGCPGMMQLTAAALGHVTSHAAVLAQPRVRPGGPSPRSKRAWVRRDVAPEVADEARCPSLPFPDAVPKGEGRAIIVGFFGEHNGSLTGTRGVGVPFG